MLLLAMDTSTGAVTVALHDGSRVLAESSATDARAHAELLAPGIRAVLAAAGRTPGDVTDVVAGAGPGPFTGLRVGLVTARTFAFATGARLHGVCSLDALAHEAWLAGTVGGDRLVVATDARRKEVYLATYALDEHGVRRLDGPHVVAPADLPAEVASSPAVGRGPLLYPDAFGPAGAPLDVGAGVLAHLAVTRLAAGEPLDELDPLYLRRPDAKEQAPARVAAP